MDMKEFLSQRSDVFAELNKLEEEIWQDPKADKFFRSKQRRADSADNKQERFFFRMMREIAEEMCKTTQFLNGIEVHRRNGHRALPPKVLDLCMAPGGFSEQVRQEISPLAVFNGITLPQRLGGYELLLEKSSRLEVKFLDITMLAKEMGFEKSNINLNHPDYDLFRFDRPFFDQKYDLVLCDGNVLRTHKRHEYRDEKVDKLRLKLSQLVFALQRIKCGGSIVMLLHSADSLHMFNIIYKFRTFSSGVQLFKSTKHHAIQSSFYIVAKGVDPDSVGAVHAVGEWKNMWASYTLLGTGEEPTISDDNVRAILDEFGAEYIEMCEPMWKIQFDALFCRFRTDSTAKS